MGGGQDIGARVAGAPLPAYLNNFFTERICGNQSDKFMLDAMWLLTGKFNSFLNIPGSKEIVLALMSDHRPGRMKTDWTRQQREREKCGRKTAARPLMKIVKSEMMPIVVLCNSDG